LVRLTFDPQAGREQAGRRPALVLSPALYNRPASLALVCPITTQVKHYPFEVALPDGFAISGVILADHVKSADWVARRAQFVAKAPSEVMEEITAKLRPLLGL
jgi:mRNA interferase MazF